VMLGQEFGAWAQAVSRDRWRLYKAEERLRQVNLGGTAAGTGINAPKKYIFMVVDKLRELTGIGLARAEYMMDPTQNADVFVEVSSLLKTSAVNLSKIANDLRLLASGPRAGIGEIILPAVQAGSSIMPGKVNPVIPEAINQIAFKVIGNDTTISIAAQSGQLELNPFLPVIAYNLFDTLDLLRKGLEVFIKSCIKGIKADEKRCLDLVENSFTLCTALTNHIGYDKASEVSKNCLKSGRTLREVIIEEGILDEESLNSILNPIDMTRPGIPGKKGGN
jgi:aspartate ammonia-lyase